MYKYMPLYAQLPVNLRYIFKTELLLQCLHSELKKANEAESEVNLLILNLFEFKVEKLKTKHSLVRML